MAVQGTSEVMQLAPGQRVEVWYVPPSPTGGEPDMSSRHHPYCGLTASGVRERRQDPIFDHAVLSPQAFRAAVER